MNEKIITFLNECNLVFENSDQLDNMEIPRDIFLNLETYNKVKDKINTIKDCGFSSSALTSLQKNALQKQKWPLLNLVRQILKANNYQMNPIRRCKGATPEGKKIYVRSFKIQKMKKIEMKTVST